MGTQALSSVQTGADTKVKDALNHVRASAQELHGAISDAVTKRGGATKADLEAFGQKVKAVTESAKSSIGTQNEAAKKHINEAVTQLEATQKHINEGLKATGQAFQNSTRQVLTDARGAVQKISEAVAAARSAASSKTSKTSK
jgi:hypothetical protein